MTMTLLDPLTYDVPTAHTAWGSLDARLGDRDHLKIGNNTYARREGSGPFAPIAVRLHWTAVVIAEVGGNVTLDSGGWRTSTTKERINRFLPTVHLEDGRDSARLYVGLSQKAGEWSITRRLWQEHGDYFDADHAETFTELPAVEFYDGMVIDAHGEVVR